MDVFTLSKHEYLQPPLPKHGRQSNQQAQQSNASNSGNASSSGNAGGGPQQTSFSTGMFGTMNQSSSS